ncbi:MAG: class I SAM-dependent methyltransferase [Verrucomicrobia bacterium]|jgi:SAM-dependent methyltransferase|nr:class I SAM-dependent methyltransferase [Verrucomicrobiota bacterium]
MTQDAQRDYWNQIADDYQKLTTISTDDFHYGPLLPGDRQLGILPAISESTTCLELGCGAAQNSIHLATRGASCTALDISPEQIRHAGALAETHHVDIELQTLALEDIGAWPSGQFDLVHSVFALPFIAVPDAFIGRAAACVAPGGTLLIATQHPVFSAEWLELEEEEMGLFLPSYFAPEDDLRETQAGEIIGSRAYPISAVAKWIYDTGLRDLRLWEPEPLPLEYLEQAPYHSPAWSELHPKLSAAPVAVIYTARTPAG